VTATLPGRLLARAADTPRRVALRHKRLGRWEEVTWGEYAERTARIGVAFVELGVRAGDRVAILADNRPEWLYADLGAQGIGAIAVGVYPTSAAAEVEYLLGHCGAVVLVAENEEQLDKALAVRDRCPDLRHVVVIDPRGVRQLDDPKVMTSDALEQLGGADGDHLRRFTQRAASAAPDDVALIVYTSGTTGPPRGALLSHANLPAAADSFRTAWAVGERDEVLSYLPLCLAAEQLVSVVNALAAGYVVNFGEGGDSFALDLAEVQPTLFVGVPRVWEKMLALVTIRMQDSSWLRRHVFDHGVRRGERIAARRRRARFGPLSRVEYAIGWLLVYRSVRDQLGLRRARHALSGAAPIAPQVLDFFWALGVRIREGYGQTENTGLATITPLDDVRIGKVGLPVSGAEVRIAADGEILTRGAGTFGGYFRDESATSAAIDEDGWLHTGDVGQLVDDGFLTITDRKKELVVTAGGSTSARRRSRTG
jgi:long-chain acyl-CoA synthetase